MCQRPSTIRSDHDANSRLESTVYQSFIKPLKPIVSYVNNFAYDLSAYLDDSVSPRTGNSAHSTNQKQKWKQLGGCRSRFSCADFGQFRHCFLKVFLSFLIGCWGYSRFGLYDTQSNSILLSHADFTKLTIVTIEEKLFSILLIFESSLKLLIFTWTEKKIGCQPEEKN